jgi:hypothetical protein
METSDKFRILSNEKESNNGFKEIKEEKDNKKVTNKKDTSIKTRLPNWSIEPPLEIKRGN